MFKCPLCSNQYEKMLSLSIHYRSKGTHEGKTSKDLYVDFYLGGTEPTCKCGCGGEVKFLGIEKGFREFVLGHAARISNNFQSKKSVANSLKTRRKMLKDGTWKPFISNETGTTWSDGLTKETDDRLAHISKLASTPKRKKIASERMKKMRNEGKIVPLSGMKSSQWKGGISALYDTCYTDVRLYKEWKLPILQASGFKCSQCGNGGKLQVHHNKVKFATILRLMAETNEWKNFTSVPTEENNPELFRLKKKIAKAVTDYHVKNKVSGEVLCRKCHGALHPSLNFKEKSKI